MMNSSDIVLDTYMLILPILLLEFVHYSIFLFCQNLQVEQSLPLHLPHCKLPQQVMIRILYYSVRVTDSPLVMLMYM